VPLTSSASSASSLYPTGTSFTVDIRARARRPRYDYAPNDQAYDVAVVEFKDDGEFLDVTQLTEAVDCIKNARETNRNGAIVVVFCHGWHHDARWDVAGDGVDAGGDAHFAAFRSVLRSLTLREAERYTSTAGGRRVVGIYIGWNGDPQGSLLGEGWLTYLSFRDRYRVASRIGAGAHLSELVRTLVASTKDPIPSIKDPAPESPLVVIGHSMGALMLETAFLALLKGDPQSLVRQRAEPTATVEIHRAGQLVSFPDVMIALNSAADSRIAKGIGVVLSQLSMTKTATAPGIRYSPPLFVSVTSTADSATRRVWRVANVHRFWTKTDGHDASLFTHFFEADGAIVSCYPRGQVDFGQNWHCLRAPEPVVAATPIFAIDLPLREREGVEDVQVPHARYRLTPLGDMGVPHLLWVFQVPPAIVESHNDIFNSRSSSLILALIQISGAVMSLAQDWSQSFEL
jgi:hypothetical protein